jgi:hypothetical protein
MSQGGLLEEQPAAAPGGANRTAKDLIKDHVNEVRNGTLKLLLRDNELMVLREVDGGKKGLNTIYKAFCQVLGVSQPNSVPKLADRLTEWFGLWKDGQLTEHPEGGYVCDFRQLKCVCRRCLTVKDGATLGSVLASVMDPPCTDPTTGE